MKKNVIVTDLCYQKVIPHLEHITEWRASGQSYTEIANGIGITPRNFIESISKYPELYKALRLGEMLAAEKVEAALTKAATGYVWNEEKVEEFFDADGNLTGSKKSTVKKIQPPNHAAAQSFLRCVNPDKWNPDTIVEDNKIEIVLSDELEEFSG